MHATYVVPFNEFVAGPQAFGHRHASELERVNPRLRSRHASASAQICAFTAASADLVKI